jgi:hypothetical protein
VSPVPSDALSLSKCPQSPAIVLLWEYFRNLRAKLRNIRQDGGNTAAFV